MEGYRWIHTSRGLQGPPQGLKECTVIRACIEGPVLQEYFSRRVVDMHTTNPCTISKRTEGCIRRAHPGRWQGSSKRGLKITDSPHLFINFLQFHCSLPLHLSLPPSTFAFFLARCCLGQVPGGAPFSQRSEQATACTNRMQIRN